MDKLQELKVKLNILDQSPIDELFSWDEFIPPTVGFNWSEQGYKIVIHPGGESSGVWVIDGLAHDLLPAAKELVEKSKYCRLL